MRIRLFFEVAPQPDEFFAALPHRWIRIEGALGASYAGKHGLQPVVIALRERIELVFMAAGAVDGHAEERRRDSRYHVVAIEIQRDLLALGAVDLFDEGALVEGTAGGEA